MTTDVTWYASTEAEGGVTSNKKCYKRRKVLCYRVIKVYWRVQRWSYWFDQMEIKNI